ncbi:MAG: hypothetical protein M1829_000480 [Trizodia sp. TS-e1964]|nr:MAG: hypothetical protein M1829_000480 [Trizodia sp. TS-e1964]
MSARKKRPGPDDYREQRPWTPEMIDVLCHSRLNLREEDYAMHSILRCQTFSKIAHRLSDMVSDWVSITEAMGKWDDLCRKQDDPIWLHYQHEKDYATIGPKLTFSRSKKTLENKAKTRALEAVWEDNWTRKSLDGEPGAPERDGSSHLDDAQPTDPKSG